MRTQTLDAETLDLAAFALYKHDNPDSVAESWKTVGLPIMLDYRERARIVLSCYSTQRGNHEHQDSCVRSRQA